MKIDHKVIRALLAIAAKHDVRYYLKSIAVDARASDVTLVATDGHALLAVPITEADVETRPPEGVYVIPREALEAVKPAKAGKTVLPIDIQVVTAPDQPDPDRLGVTIKGKTSITITGATSAVTAPIDGRYPDWRRVIPRSRSGEPAQYQPRLIDALGAAAELLGAFPAIHHNGQAGALVTFDGGDSGALGVIMPYRVDAVWPETFPAWALA